MEAENKGYSRDYEAQWPVSVSVVGLEETPI